jgi:hypothetical protein
VDVSTGQVQADRDWPTTSDKSRITPATGGNFLLITPDKLTLFSPEIQPLGELDLPVGREAAGTWWDIVPSPGGKYIWAWYSPRTQESWVHAPSRVSALLEATTLRIVLPWASRPQGFVPLDDGNVVTGDGHAYPLTGPPGGPWRQLGARWPAGCKPVSFVAPISDRALLGGAMSIHGWCYTLTLISGEVLFSQQLPQEQIFRWRAVSPGGQRFAVAVERGRGGSRALDIAPHYSIDRVMVYDVPSRRWLFTLHGKEQGITSISGVALSPDGSLLALINQDGILQVYRVGEGSTLP